MTERIGEIDEKDERQARLSDIDEGVVLPLEKSEKRRGKNVLLAILAMLLLVGGAGTGGYFLLGGKQIDLKADKRLPEKPSSGSDIRKAAYDSISDSLTVTSPASTIKPSGDAAAEIRQSKSVPPVLTGGERVIPPIQPGIAATLAPPPDSVAAKPSPAPVSDPKKQESSSPSKPSGISATSRSVRFAPINQQERSAKMVLASAREGESSNNYRTNAQSNGRRRSGLPSFGAMLPVRLMGALFTLRTGSMVRFELVRDLKSDHWQMRRGTILIGNIITGDLDRAYVQIKGYIDPETDRLVKMDGELLGDDGGAGLRGKRRRVSPVWVKVLDRAAEAGVQIATSILGSRASSVIIATDPYGTVRSSGELQSQNNRSFVEVPAGAVGFVMVTTLPEVGEGDSHLADSKLQKSEFVDQELADLVTSADPARIRAALPRMNPELRQIAEMVIKEIDSVGK